MADRGGVSRGIEAFISADGARVFSAQFSRVMPMLKWLCDRKPYYLHVAIMERMAGKYGDITLAEMWKRIKSLDRAEMMGLGRPSVDMPLLGNNLIPFHE